MINSVLGRTLAQRLRKHKKNLSQAQLAELEEVSEKVPDEKGEQLMADIRDLGRLPKEISI